MHISYYWLLSTLDLYINGWMDGRGLDWRGVARDICFAVEKVKKLRSGGREAKKGQSDMSLSLEFVMLFFGLVDFTLLKGAWYTHAMHDMQVQMQTQRDKQLSYPSTMDGKCR